VGQKTKLELTQDTVKRVYNPEEMTWSQLEHMECGLSTNYIHTLRKSKYYERRDLTGI